MSTRQKIPRVMFSIVAVLIINTHAEDILVSWETNGVLMATGMTPGSTCTVEWASCPTGQFTNSPTIYQGIVTDTNGTMRMQIPMYFRVKGIPDTRWITNDLVAYYPFDGDSEDYSGNNNTGTVHEATFIQGYSGQGLGFAGNSYVEISHMEELELYPITFSARLKMEASTVGYVFVSDYRNTTAATYYGLSVSYNTTTKEFHAGVSRTLEKIASFEGYDVTDNWCMLTVVFASADDIRIYLDGVLLMSKYWSDSYDPSIGVRGSDARLGLSYASLYGYHGAMDEIRIFKRALTDSEVQLLYQTGR